VDGTFGTSIRRMASALRTAIRTAAFGPEMLEALARIGQATRGLIYLFLGLLAITAALSETRPPSLGGAFSIVDRLPGGWIILLAIALGLCAYAAWRLIQALLDLRGAGWDGKGLLRRAGMLVEVVFYAGFGFLAALTALGQNMGIRNEMEEEMALAAVVTARVLDWPLGHWLVAAAGAGAIAIGFSQVLKARRIAFEDISASEPGMAVIRAIGRIGLLAKGAIFASTGVLFLLAAWTVEASAAGGMRAALTALAETPLGAWILLAVSVGLALYGVFCLIKAWFYKPAAGTE
jgi:hypothetical protein